MIKIKINPACAWGRDEEIKKYIESIYLRQDRYATDIDSQYASIAEDVNTNGFTKVENFIEPARLQLIKDEFESIKERGELQYDDFYTEQVAHPLLTCDSVFDVAFDDKVVEIAKNYFNCMPAITNVQLRKSKATDIIEHNIPGNGQTTLFHCDKDSPRFIKFFFYLNDVDENNGPFTYTQGSQIQKFEGWDSKYRWKHREISSIYGEDRIIKCTGNMGDLIIGNTNGFHKGTKVVKGERTILSVYYSVHPTEWRPNFGGKMRKEHYERLPAHKKPLADFLVRSEV
tara:strand:- start:4159 stop:5016 length:858 start_codon:yes stop_codon:yes gene_type:complete